MNKCKVINLYGGPGTGKSTIAAGLFSRLKMKGVNAEYIQEYAKDKAWEFGKDHSGIPKVFQAQEYIFGKQHFRMRRVAKDVDVIITDCPLMLSKIYTPDDFDIPSLKYCIDEAYSLYDNLNIFLVREKEYNPNGRFQTEEKAKELDNQIMNMLIEEHLPFHIVPATESGILQIEEYYNRS